MEAESCYHQDVALEVLEDDLVHSVILMFMWKQNPTVHHQDVALEVPEGDLVYSDILENILYKIGHQEYWFVLKN